MRAPENDPGLYSADEMCKEYGIRVLDPDGWRNHNIPWVQLITHRDFLKYLTESTIEVFDFVKYKTLFFKAPLARSDWNV